MEAPDGEWRLHRPNAGVHAARTLCMLATMQRRLPVGVDCLCSGGVRQMASNARPITVARSRLRLVRGRGEGWTLSLAAWVAWYLACLMHCDSGMDKSSVSPIIKAPSLLIY